MCISQILYGTSTYNIKTKKMNAKNYAIGLLLAAFASTAIIVSCSKEKDNGGNSSSSGVFSAPTLSAENIGTSSSPAVRLTWNAVSGAVEYAIYYSSYEGDYQHWQNVEGTSFIDNYPFDGDNYYRIKAVNSSGEYSEFSNYAYVYVSSSSPNPRPTPSAPSAPTGVTATNTGTSSSPEIKISWSYVSNATSYKVYRSSSSSGTYSQIGSSTSNTYMYDYSPMTGYNYYKVKAVNSAGESSYSSYASYNNAGGGGGGTTVPNAPTGLSINNYGSNNIPDLRLSWNASTGATSYDIYHSTSSSYGYTKILNVTSTYSTLPSPSNGNNYYKVKAKNSAGESAFSSYVSYNYTAAYSPCPPTLNASISGSRCYLNWSFPTSSGCGRPTTIRVRVKVSDGDWMDMETLSGTATSYNFIYPNYVDASHYLRVGIIGENAEGSASALKIYNTQTGQWY